MRARLAGIQHQIETKGRQAKLTVVTSTDETPLATQTALDTFLRNLPACLHPGGRVAVLTFHSGEDRRVKKAFAAGRDHGIYAEISEEVIRPSPEEMRSNSRSAPAKLRWARRAA